MEDKYVILHKEIACSGTKEFKRRIYSFLRRGYNIKECDFDGFYCIFEKTASFNSLLTAKNKVITKEKTDEPCTLGDDYIIIGGEKFTYGEDLSKD